MIRLKLMLAAAAVIAVVAACSKNEPNGITGTTEFTSVAITPTSAALHVHLVPDSISFDTAAGHPDTIPAHYVAVDSVLLAVSTVPQGVMIANALDNAVTSFSSDNIVALNGSYFVPDTLGTTTFSITYTDVNHNFAQTSATIPITVTAAP